MREREKRWRATAVQDADAKSMPEKCAKRLECGSFSTAFESATRPRLRESFYGRDGICGWDSEPAGTSSIFAFCCKKSTTFSFMTWS